MYDKYDKTFNWEKKIFVGNLLKYDEDFTNLTKDYSPKDTTYKFSFFKETTDTSISVVRESTSKILELNIFSDFLGIEKANPNGLIQFELARKFNLLTHRKTFSRKHIYTNYGWFNHITANFVLSKIEDKERRLSLSEYSQSPLIMRKSATTLDLFNYQFMNLGLNTSMFLVDVPMLKSTFSINLGVHFGRTAISDSLFIEDSGKLKKNQLVNEYGVNHLQVAPEIRWQIFPDERYGLNVSNRITWLKVFSDKFTQTNNPDELALLNASEAIRRRPFNSFEILGFFKPTKLSKLFFRYRINTQFCHVSNNFHQAQVGFMSYLTRVKK